jgi:hypothetical protein
MPATVHDHLLQGNYNKDLAHKLIASGCAISPLPLEWAAVVAFYSAVHYVNAALRKKKITVHNHTERANWIARLTELRPAGAPYQSLYTLGWNARYVAGFKISPGDIRHALNVDLAEVEAIVRSCLLTWN